LVCVFDRLFAGQLDRDALVERGRHQCLRFSWDQTFKETAEQYRTLL
jgi:hypothetical protein